MKRWISYLMIAMMLFVTVSCIDNSTPKGMVEYVLEHIKRGNIEEAQKNFLDPQEFDNVKKAMEDPRGGALLKKVLEDTKFKVNQETLKGDKATVEVSLDGVTGEALSILNKLIDERVSDLPAEASDEEIRSAVEKLLEEMDWKGLSRQENRFLYPLVKQNDKWKVDLKNIEELKD